jgi:NitT/TauT family transport system ATP-binding protein
MRGESPSPSGARKITIDHLGFSFASARGRPPVQVLNECCYEVQPGSFTCIIGSSGCGKSTLLAIIAGYLAATQGRVLIGGAPASGPGSDRLMVFQQSSLFPWYTAAQNVAFGLSLRAHRIGRAERTKRVNELLELVGLGGVGNRYPHELSGGMRQRIEIARALAVDPDILLMDEPLGALDALTRLGMQQEILKIWNETKKTILFVTHDIGEAVILADDIIVMTGRPATLKDVVHVDLPRPRSRDNRDVAAIAQQVAGLLHAAF